MFAGGDVDEVDEKVSGLLQRRAGDTNCENDSDDIALFMRRGTNGWLNANILSRCPLSKGQSDKCGYHWRYRAGYRLEAQVFKDVGKMTGKCEAVRRKIATDSTRSTTERLEK